MKLISVEIPGRVDKKSKKAFKVSDIGGRERGDDTRRSSNAVGFACKTSFKRGTLAPEIAYLQEGSELSGKDNRIDATYERSVSTRAPRLRAPSMNSVESGTSFELKSNRNL